VSGTRDDGNADRLDRVDPAVGRYDSVVVSLPAAVVRNNIAAHVFFSAT
jgi:hypothetical protein